MRHNSRTMWWLAFICATPRIEVKSFKAASERQFHEKNVSIRERLARSEELLLEQGRAPLEVSCEIDLVEARLELAREKNQKDAIIAELRNWRCLSYSWHRFTVAFVCTRQMAAFHKHDAD